MSACRAEGVIQPTSITPQRAALHPTINQFWETELVSILPSYRSRRYKCFGSAFVLFARIQPKNLKTGPDPDPVRIFVGSQYRSEYTVDSYTKQNLPVNIQTLNKLLIASVRDKANWIQKTIMQTHADPKQW